MPAEGGVELLFSLDLPSSIHERRSILDDGNRYFVSGGDVSLHLIIAFVQPVDCRTDAAELLNGSVRQKAERCN